MQNISSVAMGIGLLFCRSKPDLEWAEELGAVYTDLPEVLSKSDFVRIHLPFTAQTYHIISEVTIILKENSSKIIDINGKK